MCCECKLKFLGIASLHSPKKIGGRASDNWKMDTEKLLSLSHQNAITTYCLQNLANIDIWLIVRTRQYPHPLPKNPR